VARIPPSSPAAPDARAFDEVNRAISRRYNAITKVVVSDRGAVPSGNAWAQTTTLIHRSEIAAWVVAAKQADDDDIIIFGSRRMWNGLLAEAWSMSCT
jgi:hypothetical protein